MVKCNTSCCGGITSSSTISTAVTTIAVDTGMVLIRDDESAVVLSSGAGGELLVTPGSDLLSLGSTIVNTTGNRLPGTSVPIDSPVFDQTYLIKVDGELSGGNTVSVTASSTNVLPNNRVNPMYLVASPTVTVTPTSFTTPSGGPDTYPAIIVTFPLSFPYTSGYRTTLTTIQPGLIVDATGSLVPTVSYYPFDSDNSKVSIVIAYAVTNGPPTGGEQPTSAYIEVTTTGV